MSTRIRQELRYDGASPEQVRAMLATAEFREKVCDSQGYTGREVSIDDSGTKMKVHIDQRRPADEVPSFARKFVGEEINIVQDEDWTSPTSASLRVSIPGKPGQLDGTIRLTGDAKGTTETVEAKVKVSIPLIAGKLEKLIGDMLLKALRAENRVGRDWLSG